MPSAHEDDVTLVELLDRVLDTGVVVAGELELSVAGIDLVYVNLRLLITSSEKIILDDKIAAHTLTQGAASQS